jgi:hypothetical protein
VVHAEHALQAGIGVVAEAFGVGHRYQGQIQLSVSKIIEGEFFAIRDGGVDGG